MTEGDGMTEGGGVPSTLVILSRGEGSLSDSDCESA
jgi:hypothetical protein